MEINTGVVVMTIIMILIMCSPIILFRNKDDKKDNKTNDEKGN